VSQIAYTAAQPGAEPTPTHCFSVHAAAEPGVMPRVLELFAKRGLVPSSWTSRVGAEQDLTIDIQMVGMSTEVADYVTRCLRQITGVQVVLASRKRTAFISL
jgi:acetolactate synthase small subunit